MATVNKPILLDETGKDMAAAIREQTEILSRATITMNPADYIVDCEYVEGEVEITKTNEAGETVTETITAVTSWYERYASGWVRQGGVKTSKSNYDETQMVYISTVTLSIPMANNIYNADLTELDFAGAVQLSLNPVNLTTTSLGVVSSSVNELSLVAWKIEGMGAEL